MPSVGEPLSTGSGVNVLAINRFADSYKNQQLWQSASGLAGFQAPQDYLTQLEQVMGNDDSSISGGLDAFFGALNAASVEPTSMPLREQVLTTAQSLSQRFNNLGQLLSNQRAALYEQRNAAVGQINALSQSIAELNGKIAAAEASGVNPSGLTDARDEKIDALSALVSVQVVPQPDGAISVALKGGQPLVVGSSAASLKAQFNADGSQTLRLAFANETFTLNGHNLGGQLGGLDMYERQILQPMLRAISDMAGQLAERTNRQLAGGFDLKGRPGQPLFAYDAAKANGMLDVNTALEADQLAFSTSSSQPGKSDNLMALINLQHQSVSLSGLGTVSLSDAYTQLVGKLATDSQKNQASLSTAQTVRSQAQASWKETSGVNVDEEAINLVQYQQMYQANMKVIYVANELFDSTLAMMG